MDRYRHVTYCNGGEEQAMVEKEPPIRIDKEELRPRERAPIMPTRRVEDKRRKVGRKAKHKKKRE
ncbi:MAG TPA: hypothetical protein VFL80_06620 [Thermoanaerobaculia bacterium]|nr:hypothetical protein [Thermoanaerobaculia bacterium]